MFSYRQTPSSAQPFQKYRPFFIFARIVSLKPLIAILKSRKEIDAAFLTITASVLLVAIYNVSFWKGFINAFGGISLGTIPLYAATFLILVAFFNAILTVLAFRPFLKPVLIVLFLATSAAAYFMDHYGILIDSAMIQNVFETDSYESAELWNWRLAAIVLSLGILPSVAIWRTKLRFRPLHHDLLSKSKIILASLTISILFLLIFFKSFAPVLREHRELRFLLNPTNFIQSTHSFFKRKFSIGKPVAVMPIGTDAVKGVAWKDNPRRTVTVIVVGETARAMNFSLNGYSRNTNPELSTQAGLINFSDTQSCGTATAVSLPCVFSSLGREQYSDSRAKSQEGLLDVVAHAGFDVLWLDNNSGCKGTCDRVKYEDVSKPVPGDPLCTTEECYDERLLRNLPEIIRNAQKDMVIVLHQKGSHGPAYWKRYPKEFNRFNPVCETSDLQRCQSESIVNAYDNTILYTDHFLSSTINLLRESAKNAHVDTSMIYFSDHGESLGEKNMYLHGAPYFMSPVEQRHVPFMMWFSDGFLPRFHIDAGCLASRASQPVSHDNVFHSTLGLLNINTAAYNPSLDLFKTCGI